MDTPISDALEDRLKRRLASLAVSEEPFTALSGICGDLVEAIRDLEQIRGASPKRLGDLLNESGIQHEEITSVGELALMDQFKDLLDHLDDYPDLDTSLFRTFWIKTNDLAQDLVKRGLESLGLWDGVSPYYETFIIFDGTNATMDPAPAYLGNWRIGTATIPASKIIRNETMALGARYCILPCNVVFTQGAWMIVVNGD